MPPPAQLKSLLSYVPFRITMGRGDVKGGIGTGFLYRHQGKPYLITNWHNVTGRIPVSHACLSNTTLILPDNFRASLPIKVKKDETTLIGWKDFTVQLYKDPECLKPDWLEHAVHRDRVDVVAIPITDGFEGTAVRFANDANIVDSSVPLSPGMDVFVLGYPKGLTGGGRFPIWKRASLANEPDIDMDNLPKLFIDTATREGMSGAPVVARTSGPWLPYGKGEFKDLQLGVGERFIGVYSGRVGDDTFLAQIGIVWKEKAIIEIIENGVIGRPSSELVAAPQ
jgi:hypothetical protein